MTIMHLSTVPLLCFLSLLVVPAISEYGWRSNLEFTFNVEGRTLAGVPSLRHQYSGIHFIGTLRVQSQTQDILMMKMQDMSFTNVHSFLPRGWWQPLPSSDVTVDYQPLPISGAPFIVRLNKGVVERLVVSGSLAAWEVNFIQAVVGHLQLDLSAMDEIKGGSRNNRAPKRGDPAVYTTMENTVMGRCEVLYEIAPISKSSVLLQNPAWVNLCGYNRGFLQITKTRNYSSCSQLNEAHFGLPHTLDCIPGGNKCGAFWSRSSVSRTLGCGDRRDLILLNAVSSSRVLAALRLQPEDQSRGKPGSRASVNTYLNLTLLTVKHFPNSNRFGQPTKAITIDGLLYQYPDPTAASENKMSKSNETMSEEDLRSEDLSNSPKRKHYKSHHGRRHRRSHGYRNRRIDTSASLEMKNLSNSPEEDDQHEGDREWGKSGAPKDLLLPFSAFTLAHLEGEPRACLEHQLKELISDISNDMQVPHNMPDKMTLEKIHIAVKICRTMNYKELVKAIGFIMELRTRETKIALTERKLVRDVVLMCGTEAAFRVLRSWVEQRKVRDEAASELIAAVPSYLLTPSRDVVQQFYELVRHTASGESQLKSSVILAFSHILRVACFSKKNQRAQFPNYNFHSCRTDTASRQYLPYLVGQMKTDPSLRRVYVAAIGNTGAPESMEELFRVARDKNQSPYLRASAVLAAKYAVFRHAEEALEQLLALFHNPEMPTAVRLAALSLLFYTRPPLHVWQRLAVNTWYETSPAINAHTWSSLSSLAELKDPFYADIAENAKTVLPLARPIPLGIHRPYNLMRAAVASGLHEVALEQLSWSPDLSAANLYYRQTQRLGGISSLQLETDFWIVDADSFLQALPSLLRNSSSLTDMDNLRPPVHNLPHSTHWIRETLKIAARKMPRLEGHLAFRFGELHERVFPFDHKIVGAIEKMGRHLGEQVEAIAAKPLLYQKLGESGFWIGAPNELGFPVELRVSMPWSVRGKLEVNMTPDASVKSAISADFSAMYAAQLVTELSVYAPFDSMKYVAGAQSHTFLQLPPVRVKARMASQRFELSVNSLSAETENLLFSQSSCPYTAQHDVTSLTPVILAKSTLTINVAPPLAHNNMFPESPIKLSYESEAPGHRWSPDPTWVLSYPLLWPGLEVASLEISTVRPPPFSLVFTLGRAKSENGNVIITTQGSLAPLEARLRDGGIPLPLDLFSTTTPSPSVSTNTTPRGERNNESNSKSNEVEVEEITKRPEPHNEDDDDSGELSPEQLRIRNITILSCYVSDPAGEFNASTLDLLHLGVNHTRLDVILAQALSKISSGRAYVVAASLAINQSTPRYQVYWTLGRDFNKRVYRAGLFVVDDLDGWQSGVSAALQTPVVPELSLRAILNANLTSHMLADFRYAANRTEDRVSIKGSMLRTAAQMNATRNNAFTENCLRVGWNVQPECRAMAEQASFLERYNVTVLYNDNARRFGGPVHRYLSLVKHAFFPYLAEDLHEGVADARVRLVAELSPEAGTAAVWIRSPTGETELNGLPISGPQLYALRLNPVMGLLPRLKDPSYCGLEAGRVVTFDGTRYAYPLSDCWHVITKDCSGRSRLVVLARSLGNNRTEVEINVDNYKVVRINPGNELQINGRDLSLQEQEVAQVRDKAGTLLFQISAKNLIDGTVRVEVPAHGLTVLHANGTLLIQANSGLQGRLCGLCGDFDGEAEDDLRDPSGNVVSPNDFGRSYALRANSCELP